MVREEEGSCARKMSDTAMDAVDSEHFSPYRTDGKLYGFVCVVTGAQQPVGQAIIKELAGKLCSSLLCRPKLPHCVA